MAKGDTKTNDYLDIAAHGDRNDFPASCCETRSQTLIREVGERIMDLEDEVERLENNPDVADIVATYADLQAYDTSQLTDKDVIRVLQDETHDGDSTYYRYNKQTDTWTYIGESKQYTDFVGTDGTTAGEAGLVPAPATTDAGKFLKADGTWDTAGGGGPTVVQATGTSTTDVMSQDATTSMVFADPSTKQKVQIGHVAAATGGRSVSIGRTTQASANGAVAIGEGAQATVAGQFDISGASTNFGYTYNNSGYRLLTGLYDPQSAHDAATKGYVDPTTDSSAPTTATVGRLGQIFIDTTDNSAYICVVSDSVTPAYEWKKITA